MPSHDDTWYEAETDKPAEAVPPILVASNQSVRYVRYSGIVPYTFSPPSKYRLQRDVEEQDIRAPGIAVISTPMCLRYVKWTVTWAGRKRFIPTPAPEWDIDDDGKACYREVLIHDQIEITSFGLTDQASGNPMSKAEGIYVYVRVDSPFIGSGETITTGFTAYGLQLLATQTDPDSGDIVVPGFHELKEAVQNWETLALLDEKSGYYVGSNYIPRGSHIGPLVNIEDEVGDASYYAGNFRVMYLDLLNGAKFCKGRLGASGGDGGSQSGGQQNGDGGGNTSGGGGEAGGGGGG